MSKINTNHIPESTHPFWEKTIRIAVPGIQSLHFRPRKEIGEVLSNVILSQANVTEVKYVLGKYIELTVNNTPPDGIGFKQAY